VAALLERLDELVLVLRQDAGEDRELLGMDASGIGPGGQMAPSSPTAWATMAAVAGASPVTITVRTPKPCNSLTSAAESGAAGR
jgi:hypothetical protein